MITEKDIDWEKLKNPHPLFKVFRMDEKNPIEFWRKFVEFSRMMKNKYLYTSDEYRNDATIQQMLLAYFSGIHINILYEIGNFQGIIAFLDIQPQHKCSVMLKPWDKRIWTKEFARAGKDLVDLIMDSFKLRRMSTSSADERIVKMAKIAGFNVEGERPYAFKWKGKLYTLYELGKVREE